MRTRITSRVLTQDVKDQFGNMTHSMYFHQRRSNKHQGNQLWHQTWSCLMRTYLFIEILGLWGRKGVPDLQASTSLWEARISGSFDSIPFFSQILQKLVYISPCSSHAKQSQESFFSFSSLTYIYQPPSKNPPNLLEENPLSFHIFFPFVTDSLMEIIYVLSF